MIGVEQINLVVMILVAGVLASVVLLAYIAAANQQAQFNKINEINKNIEVFIREVPNVDVDEETGEIDEYICYQPFCKRPICGRKTKEVEFEDECIMYDFPDGTDYSNHEQVNALLIFWKMKHDLEASKNLVVHPVYVFKTEQEKTEFWENQKIRNTVFKIITD